MDKQLVAKIEQGVKDLATAEAMYKTKQLETCNQLLEMICGRYPFVSRVRGLKIAMSVCSVAINQVEELRRQGKIEHKDGGEASDLETFNFLIGKAMPMIHHELQIEGRS